MMPGNDQRAGARRPPVWILAVLFGLAATAVFFAWRRSASNLAIPPAYSDAVAEESDAEFLARYAGSKICQPCHAAEFDLWKNSHHALAQRPVDPRLDNAAFEPAQTFQHGSQTSTARSAQGRYEVVTLGQGEKVQPYAVVGAIGVDPLRQFLVAAPGGRYQVTEIAFDSVRGDWFNVYGNEDRRPGEWGHWTGRGMNWNYMCAACHNTGLRKNYKESTDGYATVRSESGVGCEACHGPMKDHAAWRKKTPGARSPDPTIRRLDGDQILSMCGSCHSRRSELTGRFQPGELFLDHYLPVIPDETDVYHPDGQVRDEDFEYVSFLGSRMHAAGVRCMDCHDMHSGKTRASDNSLCMRCHGGAAAKAPRIDPAAHSHHTPDQPGGRCVDCHMPQTTYMARHARRDHGFTTPDPLLTAQHGIPNACNRCHVDRSADWTLKAARQWYGSRLERRSRARAQRIAQARAGHPSAVGPLVKMAGDEEIALWRAAASGLLGRWAQDPSVAAALIAGAQDRDPLVRAAAAYALEAAAPDAVPALQNALRRLLQDNVRLVRVAAAWALRESIDPASNAGKDLLRQLLNNRDQPSGALQLGVYHMSRGETETALVYLRRAVGWDPSSAPLRQALAVALSAQGKTEEAVREIEAACRLDPHEAEYRFQLGLALNEAGRLQQAASALEEAVRLDPSLVRAWYNLGLAYSALEKPEPALQALARAEEIDGRSAMLPYSRATILARLNRVGEARAAAQRALALDPGFQDAAALLAALHGRSATDR